MNDSVFTNTISKGLSSEDFFAFASGEDSDRYLGFRLGDGSMPTLDDQSLLIQIDAAKTYKDNLPSPQEPGSNTGIGTAGTNGGSDPIKDPIKDPIGDPGTASGTDPVHDIKTTFYATKDLDPVRATMDFSTIVDEVVQQFTSTLGVEVNISIEIQAHAKTGFDEAIQRTIKENCNVLKFDNAEFDND